MLISCSMFIEQFLVIFLLCARQLTDKRREVVSYGFYDRYEYCGFWADR